MPPNASLSDFTLVVSTYLICPILPSSFLVLCFPPSNEWSYFQAIRRMRETGGSRSTLIQGQSIVCEGSKFLRREIILHPGQYCPSDNPQIPATSLAGPVPACDWSASCRRLLPLARILAGRFWLGDRRCRPADFRVRRQVERLRDGKTPVARFGHLRVCNTCLCKTGMRLKLQLRQEVKAGRLLKAAYRGWVAAWQAAQGRQEILWCCYCFHNIKATNDVAGLFVYNIIHIEWVVCW